jgi:hypothetical protein
MTVLVPARRWTCSRCNVSVGRIDGDRIPLPASWESGSEGDFCLSCRRSRAADAAQAAAADANGEARAKARRTGLIEFEVRRTPDLTDSTIARACRTSASTVAATRRRLDLGESRGD